ncbi:hypothetical protein FGO68_gene9976 [Halteria grandinella]|uniref:Uncharacterized protein n=1 Tax=Halteria grandinella TaxID=5974 RepID=A0A8J8P326_HALGN|nr:hypothetical protein FGO68_gene9976 [Halteria grandinella]
MKITLAVLAFILPAVTFASNCWKDAYGRGVGKVITACRDGQEKNGALCYPNCKPGYYGVGPVCWQPCPSGFRDDGAFCYKPESYGRGVGYAIWNEDNCNRDNPELGCEKWGAVWYPRCKANFHNVACCVCSPDCPSGMTDIGISCAKDSYGRGVGEPLICESGLEMSGLLCYPPCRSGYYGNGPVCWANCPAGKADCSALCTDSADGCTDTVKSIVTNVVALAVAAAVAATGGQVDIVKIIESLGGVAIDLANGICEKPISVFEA